MTTTDERAATLGLIPVAISDLGSAGGYIATNWDIPDPFISINDVQRRAGKYRLVAGAFEAFTVTADYRVWRVG